MQSKLNKPRILETLQTSKMSNVVGYTGGIFVHTWGQLHTALERGKANLAEDMQQKPQHQDVATRNSKLKLVALHACCVKGVWRIFARHVLCYECYCEERATFVPVMSHACPHRLKTFNHVCSNVRCLPKNPLQDLCFKSLCHCLLPLWFNFFLLHAVITVLFYLVSPSDGFRFTLCLSTA